MADYGAPPIASLWHYPATVSLEGHPRHIGIAFASEEHANRPAILQGSPSRLSGIPSKNSWAPEQSSSHLTPLVENIPAAIKHKGHASDVVGATAGKKHHQRRAVLHGITKTA